MVATPDQPQNLPHWLLVNSGSGHTPEGSTSVSQSQDNAPRFSKPSAPISNTAASPYNDSHVQAENDGHAADPKGDRGRPTTESFAALYGEMKRKRRGGSESLRQEITQVSSNSSDPVTNQQPTRSQSRYSTDSTAGLTSGDTFSRSAFSFGGGYSQSAASSQYTGLERNVEQKFQRRFGSAEATREQEIGVRYHHQTLDQEPTTVNAEQSASNNVQNIAKARESRIERRRRQEQQASNAYKEDAGLTVSKEETVADNYRSDNSNSNLGNFPTSRGSMGKHSGPEEQEPQTRNHDSTLGGWGSLGTSSSMEQPTSHPASEPHFSSTVQPQQTPVQAGFSQQQTVSQPSHRPLDLGESVARTPAGQQETAPQVPIEKPIPPVPQNISANTTVQLGLTPNEYMAPPQALDQSILINPVRPSPKAGWRKLVHTITGGYVNLGESEKTLRHERLVDSIRTPLRGDYRIAVLSLKGGVGKTTTSVMLGGVFATVRGDRVIAIDANPDLGTLAQRAALPGSPTIRDLLNAKDVSRYSLIKNYTTQAESRLEVIGSDRDPEVSEAFSEQDYRHAIDILQHHYNIILTDCGTGLMHSAMSGVLDLANTLIIVTSTALDGAQSASATLDWLNHHGYQQLVSNAIVVISSSQPGTPSIDVDQLMEHFQARTRAAHLIPFDRHLSEGAMIDLDRLERKTFMSYLELAGLVAHDFPNWHRHANNDG